MGSAANVRKQAPMSRPHGSGIKEAHVRKQAPNVRKQAPNVRKQLANVSDQARNIRKQGLNVTGVLAVLTWTPRRSPPERSRPASLCARADISTLHATSSLHSGCDDYTLPYITRTYKHKLLQIHVSLLAQGREPYGPIETTMQEARRAARRLADIPREQFLKLQTPLWTVTFSFQACSSPWSCRARKRRWPCCRSWTRQLHQSRAVSLGLPA